MQTDIDSAYPDAEIYLLGVNERGQDGANEAATDGRDIPWLQEEAESLIWSPWNVVYRDVIILDGNNEIVGVYNLTNNNLGVQENYDTLKSMILEAAGLP
ncbi:MAG: hypothetical protein KDA27_15945 [Candidatus Eisenbacteria bacterium]|uniref:Uncharacterized protein n=1 Tax=Eiseniibacteriota bacterium TaxID=2212470 RepID=A0A956SE36_UNCEI|nr:hypothetical protein [Candidatus Eisenbacteria bacterium]MCB9466609.1 hypothetical protein [Candidatus Eisenbacteria bacterium]